MFLQISFLLAAIRTNVTIVPDDVDIVFILLVLLQVACSFKPSGAVVAVVPDYIDVMYVCLVRLQVSYSYIVCTASLSQRNSRALRRDNLWFDRYANSGHPF